MRPERPTHHLTVTPFEQLVVLVSHTTYVTDVVDLGAVSV
jgi:hypothetical protein